MGPMVLLAHRAYGRIGPLTARNDGFRPLRAVGCSDPASGWAVCWNETQSLPKGTVPSHLLSFHAQKFGHDYGLLAWKAVTDAITDAVPEATVGANMSPAYSGCPRHSGAR